MPVLSAVVRRSALWLLLVAASVAMHASAAEHSASRAALNSITSGELQHYVDVLADDSFEGREAGSRGGRAAGGYLVQILRDNHVPGAGVDGGYFQMFGNGYRNILAVIEGRDPLLKNQFILIGAHYDHVGYGSRRNSFGPIGYIHNGADDNASGTAGLAEVIQAFTLLAEPPRRSILFAWWDGEEKGLLGSKYWIRHPTIPLENLVMTFNADMIGRLREDHLQVHGTRTVPGMRQLVSRQNVQSALDLDFAWTVKPDSDHYTFYSTGIPFLMFHTGLHADYHRPSDDAEKINAEGIQRVARLLFRVASEVADADRVAKFRDAARYESNYTRSQLEQVLAPEPPRLGVSWSSEQGAEPLTVTSVTRDGPADYAGIRPGDRLLRFDGQPVTGDDQFQQLVLSAVSPAHVVLARPGEEEPVELDVHLSGTPSRVGISWQEDRGEPGTVILTRVVPGSAAAQAGLVPKDRVYEVDGRRFADGTDFRDQVTAPDESVELLVERRGRLRNVALKLLPRRTRGPNRRATPGASEAVDGSQAAPDQRR